MCGCYDQNVPSDTAGDAGPMFARCCGGLASFFGQATPTGEFICECWDRGSCDDTERSCRPDQDAPMDAGTDAEDAQ